MNFHLISALKVKIWNIVNIFSVPLNYFPKPDDLDSVLKEFRRRNSLTWLARALIVEIIFSQRFHCNSNVWIQNKKLQYGFCFDMLSLEAKKIQLIDARNTNWYSGNDLKKNHFFLRRIWKQSFFATKIIAMVKPQVIN